MYNIKHGYGCGIKATLLTASGEVCDLRRARYKGAVLVLPNGSTIPCADVSVDDITNTMYVRLLGDRELTTIGRYGILFNVKLANGVMYSSPIVMFADVQDDAEMEYRELNISIAVTVTYLPANVAYTGASPKISPNGTWLVYNDELNAYEDTGEPASYAGVAGNIQELHEQIEERTTTTYITEAVDVDWKTVGKNAEGKLCVIGGDTQVADFIEGYLLANGYAKLSELAKTFASIEWVEGKKYITDADIPSLVSAFTNDKGYITLDAIAPYAKKATTLGGYGITNAYTKEETESRFFAFTKIDNETIKRNEDGFMYVDFSNVPTSIFDGLPIDNETIYWDGDVLKSMGGGGGGGVADSVAWANVTGKPKWLQDAGNAKPTYTASEVGALASGATAVDSAKLGGLVAARFLKGTGVIESADFNEQNVIGLYRYNSVTDKNSPADGTSYGNLLVLRSGGCDTLTQMYFNSSAKMQIFVRSGSTTNFTSRAWKQIAFTSDIPSLAGYATESWVNTALAGYLPLSGGMIYGNGADLLGINRIDGNPAIVFYHNNTTMGRLGFDTSGDAVAQVGGEYKKILHSGNISAFKAGDSAKLDGRPLDQIVKYENANASGGAINLNDSHSAIAYILSDWNYAGSPNVSNSPWSSSAASVWTLPGSYNLQIAKFYNSNDVRIRGRYNGWTDWVKLVHSGNIQSFNAGSATKLATSRTIWGQSFDGTGDVLANKGVGLMSTQNYYGLSILPDTSVYGVRTFLTYDEGSTMGAFEISASYAVRGLSIGVATGLEYNTTIIPSAASYTPVVVIKKNGNVAIGGTAADEKLHVHGNVKATGTFTTTDYIRTSKYIETGYLHLTSGIDDSFRTSVFGDAAGWGRMKALRTGGYETGSYGVLPGNYTTAMAFAMSDTHAFIAIPSVASKASEVVVGGGNADKLNWSATLLHSLNYSDYALPITGGTIKGNLLTTGNATVNALNTQTSIWASKSEGYGVVLYGTADEAVIGVHTNGNWKCPNLSLFANSNVTVHGSLLVNGGITMYSQRSLKNILSYDGLSLEQLSVIKPIKFTWKDGRDNRYHVGGVADDVATVVPEVVYSANDFLTMDYGNAGFYVAASLIKPVIHCYNKVEKHEKDIDYLKRENVAIKNENKALRDEINQLKQAS